MNRRLALWLLAAVFLVWHAVGVSSAWDVASTRRGGADFASYYYAVKVAKKGQDPYRKRLLSRTASEERTRQQVHPFFYPPTFVLVTAWVDSWPLDEAYRIWFWLDELFTLLCGLVLWRWWRELGDALPVLIVATIAVLTAIPNNHIMGQANLPVLFLVLLGLWQDDEDNWAIAGIAMGTACMLKMSPALFVAWWLLRWRWKPALMACAWAVALTLASLTLVGPEIQIRFYTRVLPTFASGNYNGLRVPIDMFGNHSIPNVLHQLVPGSKHKLSPIAQEGARLIGAGLLVAGATLFWWDTTDKVKRWAQPAAVAVLLLIIPVYTYEHHVVFAIPAVVLLAHALLSGRFPRWVFGVYGAAVAVWAFRLSWMKPYWNGFRKDDNVLGTLVVQEAKFVALLALLGLVAALGNTWAVRREPESADE